MNSIYNNRILQNILAWVIVFIIFISAKNDNYLLIGFVALLCIAVPVYINNLLILPHFNIHRKRFYILFSINVIFFTVLISLGLYALIDMPLDTRIFNIFSSLILTLIVGTAIKLTRDNFERKHKDQETELKLLKGQLNPHFLFNTLNNLYGLSVTKSDKLPSLMLKLSELLRYSIYETKETFVSLKKEIDYLENYIALEEIRLEDEVDIRFIKTGDWENKELRIAPMLLIVFVENAFKHMSNLDEKDMKVIIEMNVKERNLKFNCMNSYTPIEDYNDEDVTDGIGLNNVIKRLDLIYAKHYKYEVQKTETKYNVNLSLSLI